MINKELAVKMNVPEDRQVAIQEVQDALSDFLNDPTSHVQAKEVAEAIRGFEWVLQKLWGFPMDRNMHRYQWKANGCKCPQADNEDMIGTGTMWVNQECPFHGTNLTEKDL